MSESPHLESLWEVFFYAAIKGTARYPWPERGAEYVLNRAELIANEAVGRVARRRKALDRMKPKPTPMPGSGRKP